MATPDEELDRLRELVVDERARRAYAEKELAEERQRTLVWRRRADQRRQALRRQRTRRWIPPRLRRILGAGGGQGDAGAHPPATDGPSAEPHDPADTVEASDLPPIFPTLRVAAWKPPPWLAGCVDLVDLNDGADALAGCDLVIVAGEGGADVLADWLTWPARQPLILWDPPREEQQEWAPHLSASDLVVGPDQWGEANRTDPFLIVDPRRIVPTDGPPASGSSAATTDTEDLARHALHRSPVHWKDGKPPAEAADLVVARGEDPNKAAVLGRLVAARRFGAATGMAGLATQVGIDLPSPVPAVGVLLITRRPDRLAHALQQVARSRYPRVQLVLGLHDWDDPAEAARLVEEAGLGNDHRILSFDARTPLGACLNEAAATTGAEILAKFDDDDHYGPWYLDEAVDELDTSGAELVGKATQFVYLTHADRLLLHQPGKEHTRVGYVNGPTFVMARRAWEEVRFPHRRSRVDSVFVRGLNAVGGTIRSSSRYEFVLGRQAQGHTWEVTDERFIAASEDVGRGGDLSPVWLEAR